MAIEATLFGIKKEVRRPPDLREVEDILRDASHDQLDLMAAGRFDAFRGKSGFDFLSAFWSDPMFSELYKEAVFETERETISIQNYGRRFRGALFERMAYAHLSATMGDMTPVMGTTASQLVAKLSGQDTMDSGFGQIGVMGRYVPDGFLVREKDGRISVKSLLECSVGNWLIKENGNNQIKGSRFLIQDLDKLASKAKLTVVTPVLNTNLYVERNPKLDIYGIQVPVLQKLVVDEFFTYVFNEYRGVSGETLKEMLHKRGVPELDGKVANPASI